MLPHKLDSAPFSFYSSLMESICMRSPIHCLLLTPASKFFNKYFHVSVYFSRQPPVNQCVCQKNTTKKTSPISFSSGDSCDARAETVRPIETYKIFFLLLISLKSRHTHKKHMKGRCIASHIRGSH